MKKALVIGMMICLLLGCAACGSDTPDTTKPNGGIAGTQANQTKPADASNSAFQSDPELPGTVEVDFPYLRFRIGAPTQQIHTSRGNYLSQADSYNVVYNFYTDPSSELLYEVNLEKIKSPEDVLVQMEKQIISDASDCLTNVREYSLIIEKNESIKVNGWDMCRSEGKIHLEEQYQIPYSDADFVAYSLIKDGYPVYFFVLDVPDGEGEHIDLGDMADRIAKTFRDYE